MMIMTIFDRAAASDFGRLEQICGFELVQLTIDDTRVCEHRLAQRLAKERDTFIAPLAMVV